MVHQFIELGALETGKIIALDGVATRSRSTSGAFFYCDAVLEDDRGQAVAFPTGSLREWVLRITHPARSATTDAHAVAA
jgi:hypothetical protein